MNFYGADNRKIGFSDNIIDFATGVAKKFRKVRAAGLLAVAKEVRRRARIRIAVNRVNPSGYGNYRYERTLGEAIDWVINEEEGTVQFIVGRGIPYAEIENRQKDEPTYIQGNPVMRFRWYRLGGKPMRIRQVVRYGKNYFDGAFESTMRSLTPIIAREWAKEMQ